MKKLLILWFIVQLAFVDKYSTFWYYTKSGDKTKGLYEYDFIVSEQKNYEVLYVDIELESKCLVRVFLVMINLLGVIYIHNINNPKTL